MVTVKMKSKPGKYTRRKPIEVLAALEKQRDACVARHNALLAKFEEKIARVQARFQKSIKISELQRQDPQALRQALDEARTSQKLIRRALRGQGQA